MTDSNGASPESAPAPAAGAVPAPAAPPRAAQKSTWAKYGTPALALTAALIVGGVAGVLIGQSTASTTASSVTRGGFAAGGTRTGGVGGFGGGAGAAARGGFTAGTITAIDGSTLTVKLADGSSVTVNTSSSTAVTKSSTASVSDLASGDTVTVVGAKDANGAVTATRISDGQLGLGGFGARPGGPTGAPAN
jgi:hypothetical protein